MRLGLTEVLLVVGRKSSGLLVKANLGRNSGWFILADPSLQCRDYGYWVDGDLVLGDGYQVIEAMVLVMVKGAGLKVVASWRLLFRQNQFT